MEAPHAHNKQLAQLLNDLRTVLDNSEWTFRVTTTPPAQPVLVKGAWIAERAIGLAERYGEDISPDEAKKRAKNMNSYTLNQAAQIIELAAWLGHSQRLELLWRNRLLPYKEQERQADRLSKKKALSYTRADCTMLSLQIEDTVLKIDQTVLAGAEYFDTFVVTRMEAKTKTTQRSASIYSQGYEKIIATIKSVKFDDDVALVEALARLMPEDSTDKEGITPKLLIGFAPSDELFDIWVDQQLEHLRRKYMNTIAQQELESLLTRLREQAYRAKNKRDRDKVTDGDKISAKDIDYFRGLLRKEISAT